MCCRSRSPEHPQHGCDDAGLVGEARDGCIVRVGGCEPQLRGLGSVHDLHAPDREAAAVPQHAEFPRGGESAGGVDHEPVAFAQERFHGASRMSHASARGEIAAWVETEAARLKRRDLSSAFYPLGIEVATDELAAEVTGELVTWLGREEATRTRKRYRLVFAMEGGRIGLLRFEEREDER